MLPRALYEPLPTLTLALGSALLAVAHSPLIWLGGILLFAYGTLLWMMRSSYRRTDLIVYPEGARMIPEWLYELTPFLTLALAMLMLHLPAYGALLALLPAGWALCRLSQRSRCRRHQDGFTAQLKRHGVMSLRRPVQRR